MNNLIRPAWTPVTIAMMIFGFMLAWPLGLAVIAYIIWGDKLEAWKGDINKVTDGAAATFKTKLGQMDAGRTGNVAFDEWREGEIARLEKERLALNEARAEFDTHLRELRRAKDEEEFRSFMAERKRGEVIDVDGTQTA